MREGEREDRREGDGRKDKPTALSRSYSLGGSSASLVQRAPWALPSVLRLDIVDTSVSFH